MPTALRGSAQTRDCACAHRQGGGRAERVAFAHATAQCVSMTVTDATEFILCNSAFLKFKTGEMKLGCGKTRRVEGVLNIVTGRGLGSTSG